MNRLSWVAILFLVGNCFASCSFTKVVKGKKTINPENKVVWTGADTSKETVNITPGNKTDTAHIPGIIKAENPLIAQLTPLWKTRLVYKTFSGKAKMHFEGPDDKVEFTGHFRVKKDSIIWIYITALGGMFHAASIYITPDSFFMINYQQEQVTCLPLNKADKFLPTKVDFSSLQNLILGEPLRDGTISDADNPGDSLVLQVEDTGYIQRIVYNKSDSTINTIHLRTRWGNSPSATTEYGGYMASPNGKVSTVRIINIQNGDNKYSLDMNFSKIDFDLPLSYPFSIPPNFTIKN